MMKKQWVFWEIVALILLGSLGSNGLTTAQAATTPTPNFFTSPLLPKNQLTTKAGYFDLKVTPGATQTLRLAVTNPSESKRTLKVIPVNATTADSGTVVYVPSNRTDPSAQTTFTKLTSPAVTVTLAPHQGKTVTFHTAIPASGFSGELLGGLFVTDPEASTVSKSSGSQEKFQLANRYAEVTAVALWCQPNQTLTTTLKLAGVTVSQQPTKTLVQAKIRNLTPRLFGDMRVTAQVRRGKTNQRIATQVLRNGSMAPNSWFNLGVPLPNRDLPTGQYVLTLHVTSGRRTWQFRQPFELSRRAAQTRNVLIRSDKQGSHWWLWWLLLGLLLCLLLVIGAYWLGKRRSES